MNRNLSIWNSLRPFSVGFDTIFDEIDKYKKMLAATKNVAKPYESSSRSLYINSI